MKFAVETIYKSGTRVVNTFDEFEIEGALAERIRDCLAHGNVQQWTVGVIE